MQIVRKINDGLKHLQTWPIYIVGILPAIWLFTQAINNHLGADPLKALEHQLGVWGLQLLILCLIITPLRNLTKINLIKYRRAIGLLAFFYVSAHLLTYLWLDQQWWWPAIWKDITKRPYIIIGMVSFLCMIPLALTSNNKSIRNLGPIIWRKLHRLTYLVAIGGAVHFLLLRKTWQIEPMNYVAIVIALLAYRVYKVWARKK